MKKPVLVLAVVGFALAFACPAVLAQEGDGEPQAACPDCSAPLDDRGWCAKCGAGFAKGLRTTCSSCLAAIRSDGWCSDCGVGYVGGQKTSCKNCFAAMGSAEGGWCSDCQVGYAKGLKTKCPTCFAAIGSDGWCDDCSVGYVGGRKTSCKNCFAAMSSAEGAWCSDCQVGYAKGLKTKCPTCFAAIGTNGTCSDCGVRFQDGRSFKRVSLHVHGLDSDEAASSIRALLVGQEGVGKIEVDAATGQASFELDTTTGADASKILQALAAGGFEAHEGGH